LKNDKTIIASHFGQYYGLLQKEWRLHKIEIDWLIKVLRNGCFHNGPVICPRLSHNDPRKVVLALSVASGQHNRPCAIMTNLGHITGPSWKPQIYSTTGVNELTQTYSTTGANDLTQTYCTTGANDLTQTYCTTGVNELTQCRKEIIVDSCMLLEIPW
jgi:hypothetical protein